MAGTWQPWVLVAGDQLRPPPPYPYDSAEKIVEIQAMQNFTRTWQTNAQAIFYQSFDGLMKGFYDTASIRIFEYHQETNPPQAALVYALMSVAHYDANIACWDAKFAYWAPRPFQLDPELVTLFPTTNHPTYPAGHGCGSSAITGAMAYLFPAEAASIQARGDEAGMSRL